MHRRDINLGGKHNHLCVFDGEKTFVREGKEQTVEVTFER